MSSASSVGRFDLFFGGSAREVLRNSRNDVLPDDCAPMIRMLEQSQFCYHILGPMR